MLPLALTIGFGLVFFLVVQRATEQFRVAFRGGRLLLIRGQMPQGLLNDFADTLRRAGVQSATLVGRRTDTGLRLTGSGVQDWDLQRLRNQLSIHPYARLATSANSTRRTWWRVLGISWLAWLMARPEDLN